MNRTSLETHTLHTYVTLGVPLSQTGGWRSQGKGLSQRVPSEVFQPSASSVRQDIRQLTPPEVGMAVEKPLASKSCKITV
jgi:hypothetical protein